MDFTVSDHGTLFLLTPVSGAAKQWVEEHLPQDRTELGDAVVVEHRYIRPIVSGILADGLGVDRG